ncbi:hypothetical protein [Zobellella aerophila]|uniref:Uncharacterized protein n=1 Tax=Zobellella aerophila TaxID=870480 RepID=A0ABP6V5I8_9GAMM
MRRETADTIAKLIIGLQAVLVSIMLLGMGWMMHSGQMQGMPGPAMQGTSLWLLMVALALAWLWLCRRAWDGYLAAGGLKQQWPFWLLVVIQLPSFPLGTLMGAGLIYLKLRFHPRQ